MRFTVTKIFLAIDNAQAEENRKIGGIMGAMGAIGSCPRILLFPVAVLIDLVLHCFGINILKKETWYECTRCKELVKYHTKVCDNCKSELIWNF